MDYPLVSIISINYDHPEVTCRLLESLKQITYPRIEIIIVDNASPNDDPAILFPDYFQRFISFKVKKTLGLQEEITWGSGMQKGNTCYC